MDNQVVHEKQILVIKSINTIETDQDNKDNVNLNDGYTFEVNGSIPELADGIAKFAKELPKNGFGENSDTGFISLIQQYFNKIK